MYPLCQRMMPTGSRCQSPAVKNTRFCYFHGRRIRKRAPAIPLVSPNDHASIQHNLYLILLALQEGRISPGVADSMNRVCRAASANIEAAVRPGRKSVDAEPRTAKPASPPHRI
ncbi:MAG TPA: hypothetical protein VMU92_08835 [Acidobacteriaceae bacterium]|nr:hypothetical protein [Acidobacteriaceae bacterium]